MIVVLLVGYRLPDVLQRMQDQLLQPLRPRRKRAPKPPPKSFRVTDLVQLYLAFVLLLAMHFALSPVLALSFSVVLMAIVLTRV